MSPRRPLLALAAALACSVHATAGEARTEGGEADPALGRIAEILRGSREPGARAPLELAPLVAELGAAAVEPVLEILITRRVPETGEDPTAQVLSRPQRELLLGALARLDASLARRALLRRMQAEDTVPVRSAGLYAYGAVGRAEDVATLLEWGTQAPDAAFDPRVEQAFDHGLTELVRRVPAALDELSTVRRSIPETLRVPVVLALGGTGDARALSVLGELMDRHAELLVPAAAQIPKLGPSPSAETNRELARFLADRLDRDDPRTCPTLALALGPLEEPEPVPRLIELLDASHGAIRENALASLHRLTGLSLHGSRTLWTRWLAAEQRWYETEAEACFRELASPNDVSVSAAVRAISQHPLHRHELALRLAPLVEGPKAGLRRVGCKALGQLGSRHGVPALVLALEDADPAVRDDAYSALRAITGLEHPIDADAWHGLALLQG